MIVVRFILRFLLVPLGAAVAAGVALLVVILAHWNRFTALVAADTTIADDRALALLVFGSALVLALSITAVAMLVPALLGVLLAEAFAIRSWMFHAANGGLSTWIGWIAMEEVRKPYEFYNEPMIVVGAGIAAGFAYWAVAGWSAGFWKPVFPPRRDVRS